MAWVIRFCVIAAAGTLVNAGDEIVADCQKLCRSIPACKHDPRAHGSYCKSWQKEGVCFGIYYRDPSKKRYCFQPNDPSCPERWPVKCHKKHVKTTISPRSTRRTSTRRTSTTTDPPVTTSTAQVSTTTTDPPAPQQRGSYPLLLGILLSVPL